MAKMLRRSATRFYGCCDSCARGKTLHLKPGPRERHQARAVEKRQWKRDADRA
jgi:hypothetical protein